MSAPTFPSWLVDTCTGIGAASLTLCATALAVCTVVGVRDGWRRRHRSRADARAVVQTAEQLTREAAL